MTVPAVASNLRTLFHPVSFLPTSQSGNQSLPWRRPSHKVAQTIQPSTNPTTVPLPIRGWPFRLYHSKPSLTVQHPLTPSTRHPTPVPQRSAPCRLDLGQSRAPTAMGGYTRPLGTSPGRFRMASRSNTSGCCPTLSAPSCLSQGRKSSARACKGLAPLPSFRPSLRQGRELSWVRGSLDSAPSACSCLTQGKKPPTRDCTSPALSACTCTKVRSRVVRQGRRMGRSRICYRKVDWRALTRCLHIRQGSSDIRIRKTGRMPCLIQTARGVTMPWTAAAAGSDMPVGSCLSQVVGRVHLSPPQTGSIPRCPPAVDHICRVLKMLCSAAARWAV